MKCYSCLNELGSNGERTKVSPSRVTNEGDDGVDNEVGRDVTQRHIREKQKKQGK